MCGVFDACSIIFCLTTHPSLTSTGPSHSCSRLGHVRRPRQHRSRERHSHHRAAFLLGPHCSDARRTPSEGIRSRQWHFALHCHQHLRDHRLEGLFAHHHQHRPRYRVRGCHHRALPPAHHPQRQGARPQGGPLPTEPSQPDQPAGDRARLRDCHLLPRMEGQSARQVPKVPRTVRHLPDQAVLHLQHAHHPPDGARLEPLLYLAAPIQPCPDQRPRPPARQVARRRGRAAA